jgi:enoyl-CoA hydratase/carnithine racemase
MDPASEKMEGTPLTLFRHNAGFWRVTIDAPPFNIFDTSLLTGLELVIERMKAAQELRVIVFESAVPDYFIAHFDVIKGAEILERKTPTGILPWFDVALALHGSPVISIALIRGRTRGVGIEFVAACDMRFASEKAVFGQFEVGVATIPGGGSMEFLPLLIGRARALELIVGADDITAETAESYGLINRLLGDDKLDEFVYKFATRISQFDHEITGLAKKMINERAPAPLIDHMNASRAAFIKSILRPERKQVVRKLQEWGIQRKDDFEYNVGKYLDHINTV